ncbi:hypothetical protein TWF679_008876 [Orbilia oligospora]|uniref:RRM domain-containing protein n=1 Tax=Orbilia oligospora TaxID=2813651 RepID=A0A8H8VJR4_ORBOL|nr:hypothetical protein TWF679_008876 [Orbilia oligospora]
MSYPPPPGTSSLPPRPPPSIHASTHAFAGFKPRQVASSNQPIGAPPTYSGIPGVSTPPAYGASRPSQQSAPAYGYGAQGQTSYSAAPQTTYSAGPTASSGYMNQGSYQSQGQHQHQNQHQYGGQHQQHQHQQHQGGRGGHHQGGPRNYQNRNTQNNHNSNFPPLDPEMEAQIAEQQSIYDPARRAQLAAAAAAASNTSGADYSANPSALPDGQPAPVQPQQKKATVVRSGGGQTWKDDSLLEWDPAHFRLFVGNLAGEVTDESLLKAFASYPSVQKARVIRDKRTTKSKGYGFVAFQDGDDYFKAAREMQGKYIGSHPVLLRKSTTEIRPTVANNKKKNSKHKGSSGASGGNAALGKKEGGGVVKVKKEKGPKLLG